ncbi:uncharacterized protein V1510DRAFT_428610 [Dipodascopsis tothii]|uniref:uncharacterized protein n=1 Tax=Dipodascopsis tothii TaxID=44089 RepID=UPI0034CF61E4
MVPAGLLVLSLSDDCNALLPAGYKQRQALPSAGTKKLTSSRPRKAITNAPKTKPAFVLKLWTMVNDPKNSAHIQWMPDGQSFQVIGREQFEKTVLPKYFKHSNFSSFVRQLNMYGWHKVQDVTAGAMQSGEETGQFQSPNFVRGREDLLDNIVRNRGSKGSDDEEEPDIHQILDEIETIRMNQQNISDELKRLRNDNELLWRENYQTRERHQNFSDTLEKILRFLASVYGNPGKILGTDTIGSPVPAQRNRLMLRDASERSPILELPADSVPTVPNSASPAAINDLFGVSPVGKPSALPSTGASLRRPSVASPEAELMSPASTGVPVTAGSRAGSAMPAVADGDYGSRNSSARASRGASLAAPAPAGQVFDNSDFLDIMPLSDKTTSSLALSPINATAAPVGNRTIFPDLLDNNNMGGMHAAAGSVGAALNPLINDLSNQGNSTLVSDKIQENSRSIDDLTHALDMQGQSLEQVQDWLSKNIGVYGNSTPNPVPDEELPMPNNSFDVGEFLASPGPGSFYDDAENMNRFISELPPDDADLGSKRRRLT